jgi:hypothetical protein
VGNGNMTGDGDKRAGEGRQPRNLVAEKVFLEK